jgi:succinoglycan biosynthesis protein ExoA
MTIPNILIVIPCLNEEAYIGGLVTKLVQNVAGLPTRIVIADGGSTDKTLSIIAELTRQFPNVILLNNPKRLQSAAVNLAVATYGDQADILIRMDAHADFPEDYVHQLVAEQNTTNADSVVVAMETVGTTDFQRAVAAAQNSKLGNGGSAHRIIGSSGQWVDHGHHALMRITAFRTAGGYDENFSHNEDAELDIRMQKCGFKIWLTGKTSHTYYPRSAPYPLFRQYYKYGEGRARNLLKHRTRPRLRQMVPVAVAPAVLMLILAPLAGIFAIPCLIWTAICLSYSVLLAIKAKDPTIALSGPAAMIMHVGWSLGFWHELIVHIIRGRS